VSRDAEARARAYERAAPAKKRSLRGLFFTPDAVADTMARRAIALWRASQPVASRAAPTVLDPSCGAGALLAAAARALDAGARLVGTDLDPEAIALARERLGARALLEVGDALLPGPSADIVLTNPPYGRDPRSADRDRFVTFWRAALARVSPGGVLAVLAPTSWRTGVRYAAARREVMGPSVREIVELPRGSFPDAYVDTCVALCTPRAERLPSPPPEGATTAPASERLGGLFQARRGILAPPPSAVGEPLLVGRVVPFAWPRARSAFTRVRREDVVEGKAALALDRGPRLLVRRIVGRAGRLTCVTTSRRALVKKDFYVLVARDADLCLPAYAALLHARGLADRLAAREVATTKNDFAQVTLARLRELSVPRLATPRAGDRIRIRRLPDAEVDARDPRDAAAWLDRWAREAATLGAALCRERVRRVDADPRWDAPRRRLDAFVDRMYCYSP
jgi:predicted RNA methylase